MTVLRWASIGVLVTFWGCTSVRLQARDGCWVRQTEKLGRVIEEMGPCVKPESAWVADRPTRLVQECIAQASWRYQNEALAAWERGERFAEPPTEAGLLEACQLEAARTVTQQNEALEARLNELRGDHERAVAHNEHLSDVLGEAAKKPAGTATATATADGRSSSSNDTQSAHTADVAPPQAPIVVPYQAPIVVPYAPKETEAPVVVRYWRKPEAPSDAEAPEPARKPLVAKATPAKQEKDKIPKEAESRVMGASDGLVCEPAVTSADCSCPVP